jgi:hypothetical protein
MHDAAEGLPSSMFSQYGSNITADGDVFPTMAKVLGKIITKDPPQPNDEEITDSGHPPVSPSNAKGGSPGEKEMLTSSLLSPSIQDSEKEQDSHTWESNPDVMRAKERRSKSNADRPSLVRSAHARRWPLIWISPTNLRQGRRVWWTPS